MAQLYLYRYNRQQENDRPACFSILGYSGVIHPDRNITGNSYCTTEKWKARQATKRSRTKWTLDTSYLERHFGISIKAEAPTNVMTVPSRFIKRTRRIPATASRRRFICENDHRTWPIRTSTSNPSDIATTYSKSIPSLLKSIFGSFLPKRKLFPLSGGKSWGRESSSKIIISST
jgi:hypothetical protein